MTESLLVDSGLTVPVFSLGNDLISCLKKAMASLTVVASLRVTLQQVQGREGQSYFDTGYKSNATSSGGNNASGQARVLDDQAIQSIIPNNAAFLTEDLDTYDFDLHMLTKPEVFYDNIHKQALGYQNLFYLKKVQRIKPTLYDGTVISNKHISMPVIDDEETLILKEDFEKCFVPRQELLADEAFLYHTLNPSTKSSDTLPVKIEAPEELPKVILVNKSLKKLKLHLSNFDKVVKIRTTPNARTEGMFKLDLDPLAPKLVQNREAHIDYLKYTQEQADILRGIVKQAEAKQPLDNAAKKVAATPKNNVKKVRFAEPLTSSNNIKPVESSKTSDFNTPVLSPTRLKCSASNCGSKPIGNKKNDRISQTPSRNMKNKVEAQPRKVNKKNHVLELIRDVNVKQSQLNVNSKLICATCKKSMFNGVHDMCLLDFIENVVQIVLWYLDSECSKHMTGNRSQLMNFVSKFLGTVRFENDHIARIIGYGNYQLGNVTISRVYYVERLGHKLFSVGQCCDVDREVAFQKNTCFIHIRSLLHPKPFFNPPLIQQTPYELMQDKKLDLSFFHVFGSLCYPTNDNDDLGKLDAKADIGIFVGYALAKKAFIIYNKRTRKIIETIHVTFDELTSMAFEQFSSGPGLHSMTPATSISGLFKKPASPQLFIIPVLFEEPTKKSKRLKRSAKKSTMAPAGGVVIRETPEMPFSKKKEKSLRDFHKTHPSGSSTVTKTAPSAAKIKPSVTNKGTGVKPRVLDVFEEESSERSDEENDSDDKNTQSDNVKGSDSEHKTDENELDYKFDHQENEEKDEYDKEEEDGEFVKAPSNDSDDEDEIEITDKA
nr:integrase, catalytic region, zinc finger, CCHC-type, peptidase aspartic, catalytic [Tanacetum cinerariifolium]